MFNIETYGKTAMRRLFDLGILGDDVTFAHFVWTTDEDLALFADSGVVASNNPGSNLRLSSGIARVRDIMALGGSVGFGTNGISYSDTEDFFQEPAARLLLATDPEGLPRRQARQCRGAAFRGESGSRAVGYPGRLGRLTAGTLADLLVVSKDRLLFPAERYQGESVLNLLLDRADSRDIRLSMINGQVVLEEGVITTLDEHAIVDQVAEATERGMYSLSTSDKRRAESSPGS